MQPIDDLKRITVFYHGREVGSIARTAEGLSPFEYCTRWLADGFSLNPLILPLKRGVFMPKLDPLHGMFGVFDDSLPDGWGRLLVDRTLQAHGKDPASVDGLARLALVGHSGMGALCYEPAWETEGAASPNTDFDHLAKECTAILAHKPSNDLDTLFALGGSSGGARPKILTEIEGQDWMVKFPSSYDPKDIGAQEYHYACCAQKCGITMPEVRLFPSRRTSGYFGVRRFDRGIQGERIHMASVAGLLETSHRLPNLDYKILMKLTLKLTDGTRDVKQLFRRMCFNVFAHNRDDHSKNFSFLFDEEQASWYLAPAYDLTYSSSLNGEHATTVAGNGKTPGFAEIKEVADYAGLSLRWAQTTAKEIAEQTRELKQYFRAQ